MKEEDSSILRREFLGAAGAGIATALAGCAGDEGESTPSGSETTENPDTSSRDDSDAEESPTDSAPENQNNNGDNIYNGEEDFEEWLSSHEMDAVPESHWMEFEDPENHFELPLTEYVDGNSPLTYNIQEKKRGEGLGQYDSLYIAVTKDSAEELQFAPLYFTEDEWDASMSARENIQEVGRLMIGGYNNISENDLEAFFEEDVLSYDDVSEDFPQEYLDLVEE